MSHATPTPFVALLLVAVCAGCNDGTIADDWGPSAGHARVEGHVFDASGARVAQGMEVALTRCGSPIGGYAGSATSDSQGAYSILGSLPPVGLLPELPDSLEVQCEIIAGRGYAESGPVNVLFFTRTEPRPLRVDLHEVPSP